VFTLVKDFFDPKVIVIVFVRLIGLEEPFVVAAVGYSGYLTEGAYISL